MAFLTAFAFLLLILWMTRSDTKPAVVEVSWESFETPLKVLSPKGWLQKRVGLLNHRSLAQGEGLLLRRARKVHTIGMAFPIDIVFLDASYIVVGVICDVQPGESSLRGPPGSRHVIELAAGTVQRESLKPGTQLLLQERELNNK